MQLRSRCKNEIPTTAETVVQISGSRVDAASQLQQQLETTILKFKCRWK